MLFAIRNHLRGLFGQIMQMVFGQGRKLYYRDLFLAGLL